MKSAKIPVNLFEMVGDHAYTRRFAELPPHITFEDLFSPSNWSYYGANTGRFSRWDIIRVVSGEQDFDVDLTVTEVVTGGLHVKVRGGYFKGKVGAEAVIEANKVADAVRPKVAADKDGKPNVYVQFRKATNWRVMGPDGEISRNHETEAAAVDAMNTYLKQVGMVLPTEKDAA